MLIEIRMSDDGRVAALFRQAEESDRADRPWCVLGWPEDSFITVWALTDSEVEDWKVLYCKED